MSIYQLSSANFTVTGFQRKSLDINVPGPVLVFFKTTNCEGCNAVTPIFNELSRNERGINYGIISVDIHRDVVQMSRQTSAAISSVPFFILYIDGKPLAKYTGKKDVMSMRSFIVKAMQSIQSRAPDISQSTVIPQLPPTGGGGMYGNGGYSHPNLAPPTYSNNPGARQNDSQYHMPEIGNAPNLKNVIKGGNTSQYAYLNDVEEEDEEKLLVPNMVTPHNVPWESSYKKMGTAD